MLLLVPFYDLSYASRILDAAKHKKIAVIANVDSGPGRKVDPAWKKKIEQIRQSGADIYYYIDLATFDHGGRQTGVISADEAKRQVEAWRKFYGPATGQFYDDWQDKTTKALPDLRTSIANPGWDMATSCHTTVIWEAKAYLKAKPSGWFRSQGTQAVIAMAESDYRPALKKAQQEKIALFYAVAAQDTWAAYNDLPPYFEAMAREI